MHLTTDAKQQDMKQRRASRGCSATVLSYVYFGEGGTREEMCIRDREQEQKRKIELKALQSQINPHFLYNTLDSIIWMAEGKKNEEVVIMTASLARLLRQSISNEDELVTIGQELSLIHIFAVTGLSIYSLTL